MKKIILLIIILICIFLAVLVCSNNLNITPYESINAQRLNANVQFENTLSNNSRSRCKKPK
jgi:uncharacterized alpha/beta hydrolase family protein